jgi:hypothetical protein
MRAGRGERSSVDNGTGTTIGESPTELSDGVFGIDINGDDDKVLGVGTMANSVKGETSSRSYGFWLLWASSSRRVDGMVSGSDGGEARSSRGAGEVISL